MSDDTSSGGDLYALEALDDAFQGVDLRTRPAVPDTIAGRRRRRGLLTESESILQFVEHEGFVFLREAPGTASGGVSAGRRSRRGLWSATKKVGRILKEVPFGKLKRFGKQEPDAAEPPARNTVKHLLAWADQRLTPSYGLWEAQPVRSGGEVTAVTRGDGPVGPVEGGRVLLFVHGTFSCCEKLFSDLSDTAPGREFLARTVFDKQRYKKVLAFNHPTLGVSPMLNARELSKSLDGTTSAVDVVCHSRGGLVTRCWLESMDFSDPARRRAVFVGSPLDGTRLASPPRLRATLNQIANIGSSLAKQSRRAAEGAPFFFVAAILFQIFSSVTKLVSKTPVVDAAIAMIPGLDAQSPVEGNQLLRSLHERPQSALFDRYFVVRSDFEPFCNVSENMLSAFAEGSPFRFMHYFKNLTAKAANLVADPVFDRANDLVVDTESMTAFTRTFRLPAGRVLDFGTNEVVHHTNYFKQSRTVERLAHWLK